MKNSQSEQQNQSVWRVMRSIMASFVGVQSKENLEEDFKKGKASTYILVGIIATLAFVLTVFGIVKLVMAVAVP